MWLNYFTDEEIIKVKHKKGVGHPPLMSRAKAPQPPIAAHWHYIHQDPDFCPNPSQ